MLVIMQINSIIYSYSLIFFMQNVISCMIFTFLCETHPSTDSWKTFQWKTDLHMINSMVRLNKDLTLPIKRQKHDGVSLASLTLAYRNISMLMSVGMVNWLPVHPGQNHLKQGIKQISLGGHIVWGKNY